MCTRTQSHSVTRLGISDEQNQANIQLTFTKNSEVKSKKEKAEIMPRKIILAKRFNATQSKQVFGGALFRL